MTIINPLLVFFAVIQSFRRKLRTLKSHGRISDFLLIPIRTMALFLLNAETRVYLKLNDQNKESCIPRRCADLFTYLYLRYLRFVFFFETASWLVKTSSTYRATPPLSVLWKWCPKLISIDVSNDIHSGMT